VVTIVVLDTGPLGLVTNPKTSPDAKAAKDWLDSVVRRNARIIVPEISDYELRRELLRAGKLAGLQRLNDLIVAFEYLPITTDAMRKAADLWAEARKTGQPTASNAALDGDVILAAQTLTAFEAKAIIATSNVAHLTRFARADVWSNIT
jgi:predicted nucleic acid-binding protein